MANVFEPEWDPAGDEQAPFTARCASIGEQAGTDRLGAAVYELAPGEATFPLHFHAGNEEMLVVLAGRPTLRTLEGERQLDPGELVAFRTGPEGAHRLDNRTDEPVRLLMVSTMRAPDVIRYPDSDKVNARTHAPGRPLPAGGFKLVFRAGDAVGYYDGELDG
jgi:uncharacterized cupin superfamily protein